MSSGPDRRDLLLRICIVVVAAAPGLAATISVIGIHWVPGGDQAIEVLRTTDVGGSGTPLVGPWSRWGWAHPGPALFWLLAPTQHLFGNDGVLLACGLLSTASAAGVAAVAIRRGGTVLGAIAGLGVVVFLGGMGLSIAVDPWNPYVALLPFLLFVLLIWSVVCDDLVMAPVAAIVGSFCVQSHVGFLPLVAGLSAGALGAVAVRHAWHARSSVRSDSRAVAASGRTQTSEGCGSQVIASMRRHRLVSTATWTGLALLAIWMPPLLDQLVGSGNLSELGRYARSPQDATAGWSYAFGIMNAQLRLPSPWMGAGEINEMGLALTSGWLWGVATIVLLLAAFTVAVARGRSSSAGLDAVALIGICLALLSTSRVTGFVAPYMVQWWWVVSLVGLLALVWTFAEVVGAGDSRGLAIVVLSAASITAGAVIVRDVPVEPPVPTLSSALGHVVSQTASALEPGGRYVVRAFDERNWGGAGPGLLLGLEQLGIDAYAPPDRLAVIQYGEDRVLDPAESDGVVDIVGLDSIDNGWRPPSGAREIARYDPLDRSERREFAVDQRSIRAAMGSDAPTGVLSLDSPSLAAQARASGISDGLIERMQELQARGSGFAVFLSPPTT